MKTEAQVGAEFHMQNFVQFHACFTSLWLVVKDKLNCTSERGNTKSQQAQNFDTQQDIILCFQLGLMMLRESDTPLSSHWMSIHLEQLFVHCKYSNFKLWRNSGIRYMAEICRTKTLFRALLTSPWRVLTLCQFPDVWNQNGISKATQTILDMAGLKEGLIYFYIRNFLKYTIFSLVKDRANLSAEWKCHSSDRWRGVFSGSQFLLIV